MTRPEPSGLCVIVIGPNDIVQRVSEDVPGSAVERPVRELFGDTERQTLERALGECRETGEMLLIDACPSDGARRRWKHLFVPAQGSVVWVTRDLSAETTSAADARRLETLLRHSSEVLNLLDRSLRIVYRSPSQARPMGYADGLVGRSALEIVHPDDRETVLATLGKVLEAPRAVERVVLRAKHADGSWRHLHVTATNLLEQPDIGAILLAYRDITDERRAEDRLLAASRLASIGTLAAGVGHEINNPLTYVLGNLDRVLERLLTPGSSNDARALLAESFELIAKIVADLKLLSAPERDELVAVDVDAAAERALTIIGSQLRSRAKLSKKLSTPPPALAAESRLVQALINLLTNAVQALPAAGHNNEIEISTTSVGAHVVVSVRDNGSGIPGEIRGQIFEPYFTTKRTSGGSGLGLWVVRRIVEAFGGSIDVATEVDRGSTFSLVLRRAPAVKEQAPAPRPLRQAPSKQGRVLVVDDQRLVAASLSRTLEAGHDVAMATSGQEVLDRFDRGERWDVVVSDVVMPGMNGLELQQRLSKRSPELGRRFIFLSGGGFDADVREALEALGLTYLSKPPDLDELRAAVARLIR